MGTQLLVRIEPELKARLIRIARSEGKSASQVVRELVEGYVRSRDPARYLEGLWDRIGGQLRQNGFGPGDVERIVRRVRQESGCGS